MRGVLPLPRAAGLCARSAVRPARPPAPRSHALIARRAAPAGLGGPLPPVAPVVPPPASESLADGADKQHAPPAPRASVIRAAAAGDEPRPLDPLPAAATGAADATAAAAPAAAAGAKPPDAAPAAALPSAAESAQAADDAIEAAARLLLAPYHAYARALEERPLLTKACTRCDAHARGATGRRGARAEAGPGRSTTRAAQPPMQRRCALRPPTRPPRPATSQMT